MNRVTKYKIKHIWGVVKEWLLHVLAIGAVVLIVLAVVGLNILIGLSFSDSTIACLIVYITRW